MPLLDVDGFPLHYLHEGQGPAVLLFHAYPLNAEQFRPQIAALADRFRFLVPDARGFGRSGEPAGPTTMTRMAQDGLAILESLGIERAVVGGVSMGGYATMALLGEDAGRIRALVLSDTQALPDTDESRVQRERSALEAETGGVEPVLEAMLPKLLAPEASAAARAAVASQIRSAQPAGIAAAQRGMALRLDARQHLARFAGPALIVVGAEDRVTPLEKAEQLQSLVGGSRLEVIPGAAHLPNLEQPEAFNRLLDGFLSSLPD